MATKRTPRKGFDPIKPRVAKRIPHPRGDAQPVGSRVRPARKKITRATSAKVGKPNVDTFLKMERAKGTPAPKRKAGADAERLSRAGYKRVNKGASSRSAVARRRRSHPR